MLYHFVILTFRNVKIHDMVKKSWLLLWNKKGFRNGPAEMSTLEIKTGWYLGGK
jgi:hypothetical protein